MNSATAQQKRQRALRQFEKRRRRKREISVWQLNRPNRAGHVIEATTSSFAPAWRMHPGDQVQSDKSWVTVTKVEWTDDVEPVYNLQVADHHTYFVAASATGPAVLVHNDSPKLPVEKSKQEHTKAEWIEIAIKNAGLADDLGKTGRKWIEKGSNAEENRAILIKIYENYARFYAQDKERFLWAGLATLAGHSVVTEAIDRLAKEILFLRMKTGTPASDEPSVHSEGKKKKFEIPPITREEALEALTKVYGAAKAKQKLADLDVVDDAFLKGRGRLAKELEKEKYTKLIDNALADAFAAKIDGTALPGQRTAYTVHLQIRQEMERILTRMALDIFLDLAWMHEAYIKGGIGEMQRLNKAGQLDDELLAAWEDIHSGKADRVNRGSMRLAQDEQIHSLRPGYRRINDLKVGPGLNIDTIKLQITVGPMIADAFSNDAKSKLPGAKSFREVIGKEGSMTDDSLDPKKNARWKWVSGEVVPAWGKMSTKERDALVDKALKDLRSGLLWRYRRIPSEVPILP